MTIPEHERDDQLAEKLKGEWPGILQWIIAGALEWGGDGLQPPETVQAATEAYFHSEDASHGFELKAYKIKVNLPQDKRGHVEFVADKVGTFRWRCSRPCGNGCAKMLGRLVVME